MSIQGSTVSPGTVTANLPSHSYAVAFNSIPAAVATALTVASNTLSPATQNVVLAAGPAGGNFQLAGGPLTATTGTIQFDASEAQVASAESGDVERNRFGGPQRHRAELHVRNHLHGRTHAVQALTAIDNLTPAAATVTPGALVTPITFGAVNASNPASPTNPQVVQQALERLAGIGPGGVVVSAVTGSQMLVTFTEGTARNLRGLNLADLLFHASTGSSVASVTQGGLGASRTIGNTLTLTGGATSASVSIGTGTTLVQAGDVTVASRVGIPATAPGVAIRAFTTASQNVVLAGDPAAGSYRLTGGPLTRPDRPDSLRRTPRPPWPAR